MNARNPTWVGLFSAAVLVSCAAQTSPTDNDDLGDPYPVAVRCDEVCNMEGRCRDTGLCTCYHYPGGQEGCYSYGLYGGDNSTDMAWGCCQAYSPAQCEGSVVCVEQGRCELCDGTCEVTCPP